MELFSDRPINKEINGNKLEIEQLKFTLNQKSLFRVYSRGKWTMHGRWYGSL
jgi:hypothetical protein